MSRPDWRSACPADTLRAVFEGALALALTLSLQTAADNARVVQEKKPPPAAVQWTDDRPATRLFLNLWKDIKALPSANSAAVLAVGGAGALAVHSDDRRLASWSQSLDESDYTVVGRVLGDGWTHSGGAVATYVIGRISGSPQWTHIGSDLIRAQALNGLITTSLKVTVNRKRPTGAHYSFPSGHTSATFASAATLHAHYGWKAGVPAFAAAGFVAWTRARDGVHWLSDVAFGAAVGIVAGRTVTIPHMAKRVAVVPTPTKGGFALTFVISPSHKSQVSSRK